MALQRFLAVAAVAAVAGAASAEAAGDPEECRQVNLEQVNWTGVTAKTETLAWLLEQLGYETDNITASVPIMFDALKREERDVFLGLWLPTMHTMVEPYMLDGDIDIVGRNLGGAKYTLAVPSYVHEAGVRSFADLAEHRDRFDGEIYGIEPGNDGNELIVSMIEEGAYGLDGWSIVESSEAGMLTQVQRAVRNEDWIVFLGWEPHPMNLNIDMEYLAGGEDYFGPEMGGANVYTIARRGYAWQCPNVGQILENYQYTLEEQNMLGHYVINEDMDYLEAGQALIRDHPELIDRWFGPGGTYDIRGTFTFDGEERAAEAIRAALDLS